MSDNRHTPGPWAIAPGNFIIGPRSIIVAEVPCQGANNADLPLIATAPELLDALECVWAGVPDKVREALASGEKSLRTESATVIVTLPKILRKIQAAIAKAKGAK